MEKESIQKVKMKDIPKGGLFIYRKEVWRSLGKLLASSHSCTAQKAFVNEYGTEIKCEFKPFDKVLVRDYLKDKWMPNFFSCYDGTTSDYKYGCIAGNIDNVVFSRYCIPYNEETKHLLGTTDEWKGGEG